MSEDIVNQVMDEQIDLNKYIFSPKEVTTTTVPKEIKNYCVTHNIDINRLVEVGFRTLVTQKKELSRIRELEDTVKIMQENIATYQRKLRDMITKWEEFKKKYNIGEDL